jgi:hypothetical protein
MNAKAIKFSELNDCWSADRYVGHCKNCPKVDTCKLPESKAGRIANQKESVAFFAGKLKEAKKKLAELEK